MTRLRLLPSWRVGAGLVLCLVGLGAGWLWFRDSSLARVREVQVTGIGTSQEAAVRAALRDAGEGMSTLHIDHAALERAVAPFSSVESVHAEGDFPHTLKVEVRERRPVGAVLQGDRPVPATAGGLLLEGVSAAGLPTIAAKRPPIAGRVTDPGALAALRVAAAAPAPLRSRMLRLWSDGRGTMLSLRRGPDLVFGSASGAETKWAAAARVLAEDSAQGATYLDLRIPRRVAAGGVGPLPTPDATSTLDSLPQG
jgi:cell division protein FtsQ